MTATSSTEILEKRIEQLVREHIAAVRAGAEAAVARAFAEPMGRLPKPARSKEKLSTRRAPYQRRTREVVADLAERLCAAVHASPGETMTHLAAQVGATPSELSLPVDHLRHEGRLRSVGQRQHTRYFPAAPTPKRTS
jgi:hypothetical protein